ncbi:MAG: hypothetical protein LBD53_11740 [Tannerella sp.]|nr:hypothetical protein [Tannerella sp.]
MRAAVRTRFYLVCSILTGFACIALLAGKACQDILDEAQPRPNCWCRNF